MNAGTSTYLSKAVARRSKKNKTKKKTPGDGDGCGIFLDCCFEGNEIESFEVGRGKVAFSLQVRTR